VEGAGLEARIAHGTLDAKTKTFLQQSRPDVRIQPGFAESQSSEARLLSLNIYSFAIKIIVGIT